MFESKKYNSKKLQRDFFTILNGGKAPTNYGITFFMEQALDFFVLIIRASIMSKPKFSMPFQIFKYHIQQVEVLK
jgi:hypothetical protein